jgi:hypothetical protein
MSFKTTLRGFLVAASFASTNLVAMDHEDNQGFSRSHTTGYSTSSFGLLDGTEQSWNNSVKLILPLSFALLALQQIIRPSTPGTLLEDLLSSRMSACLYVASLNMFNKALYDAEYGPLDELKSNNYDEEKMSLLLIAGGYCVSKICFEFAKRYKEDAAELERKARELAEQALSDDRKLDILPFEEAFEEAAEDESKILREHKLQSAVRSKNKAIELAGVAHTISYLAFVCANWFHFYTASKNS